MCFSLRIICSTSSPLSTQHPLPTLPFLPSFLHDTHKLLFSFYSVRYGLSPSSTDTTCNQWYHTRRAPSINPLTAVSDLSFIPFFSRADKAFRMCAGVHHVLLDDWGRRSLACSSWRPLRATVEFHSWWGFLQLRLTKQPIGPKVTDLPVPLDSSTGTRAP